MRVSVGSGTSRQVPHSPARAHTPAEQFSLSYIHHANAFSHVSAAVMDPVTALGVASAAVQFLQCALEALSLCRQIRDDYQGATEANRELENYSSNLKDLSKELDTGTQQTNHAGRRIYKIAKECVASATELQALLFEVRKAGNSNVINFTKTAFRTMKDRKTIEKLQRTLQDRRANLDSAIVQDIR